MMVYNDLLKRRQTVKVGSPCAIDAYWGWRLAIRVRHGRQDLQ